MNYWKGKGRWIIELLLGVSLSQHVIYKKVWRPDPKMLFR
jgi:hypothetical protein